jgi:hypothetical protein
MNFSQSYTKVQYSMDTSLIKNKREFARRMYVEGMMQMFEAANDVYNKTNSPGEILIFLYEEIKKVRDVQTATEESK